MTAGSTSASQIRELEYPVFRAAVTSVAWRADQGLDLAEWIRQGKRLGVIGRGAAWWVGDWVNYGNETFGEKYTRAARVTGYDVQSLMNMAYVASRFEISRRRETLSWSHHAEVAPLAPEHQDQWLSVAASKGLSVRGLREELRTWRHQLKFGSGDEQSVGESVSGETTDAHDDGVVCPQCGFDLGPVSGS